MIGESEGKNMEFDILEDFVNYAQKRLEIENSSKDSLLNSAVQATEDSTRTEIINEQAQTIKSIAEAKTQEQETQKDVGEQ